MSTTATESIRAEATRRRVSVWQVRKERMGERDAWRALAIEASLIGPVMKGIGMTRCAFCSAPAAPDYLPEHKADCLVLRVRALAAAS